MWQQLLTNLNWNLKFSYSGVFKTNGTKLINYLKDIYDLAGFLK